jgi:hypothetical protein
MGYEWLNLLLDVAILALQPLAALKNTSTQDSTTIAPRKQETAPTPTNLLY